MENFSTPRAALLPKATNVVTLAVLVAATWWSGAQRPADQAAIAAQATSTATSTASTDTQHKADAAAPAGASTQWPAQATILPREGLQAVGYQARIAP